MEKRPQNRLSGCIRQVVSTFKLRTETDQELLRRFVGQRDEAAFAAVVRRHGPMVLRVALRTLKNEHDAEDVFQATFLVLSQKAQTLRRQESLGSWLYGIAYRLALKAKATAGERRNREQRVAATPAATPLAQITVREAQTILDEELNRLPKKFREPVVLCCFEGLARDEAAQRIGCPASVLKSHLEQGRERLRQRLIARGLTLPCGLGAFLLLEGAAPATVPPALIGATTKAAITIAAGKAVSTVVTAKVTALTEGVLRTMFLTKMRIAIVALVLGFVVTGTTVFSYRTAAAQGDKLPIASDKPPTAEERVKASDPPPAIGKKDPDAPVPAAKEPAWTAVFRKAYGLKDGEYVKRVPSPFIPERKDFLLPRFPGADEISVKGLLAYGVLFVDADGNTLSYRAMVSTDATDFEEPPIAVRKKRLSLRSVIAYSTGRMTPEVVFNARAKDQDVFMECDFVIRKGARLEKLLPDLQKAIGQCELDNPDKRPVLTLKEEEQEVYVVRGKFKITPRKWRNKDEVDVYADEGVLNKEFTNANPEATADVSTDINTDAPLQFVRELGSFVNKRMVWDTEAPINMPFRAYTHQRWENKATAEEQAADRDPEKVLKNVSEQTGLTFTKEKRKVQVLYVVTP